MKLAKLAYWFWCGVEGVFDTWGKLCLSCATWEFERRLEISRELSGSEDVIDAEYEDDGGSR